jgi:hypothetical protein|tara:strand:- start:219 stop:824 length:606 start_codon:yes stop_codon:yes gene_type:complete
MKKLLLITAMFMATSAWAIEIIEVDEWTETCKYNGEEYVETDELLYDKNNWTFSKTRYNQGIRHTIWFSTLTNFNPPLGAVSSLKSEYKLYCPTDFDEWEEKYGAYIAKKVKDSCFSKINAEGEKLCEERSKEKQVVFHFINHYKVNPFGKVAVDLCNQLELNFLKEKYPETYKEESPPFIWSCDKNYSKLMKVYSGYDSK